MAYFWLFMGYILRENGIDGLCEGGNWYSDFIFKKAKVSTYNPFIRFNLDTYTLSSEDESPPTFPNSLEEMKENFYPVLMVKK